MIFSYIKYPAIPNNPVGEKFVYRPFVVIDLGHNGKYTQTIALLDTGADWNFAPMDYVDELGIDLTGGITIPVGGVGQGLVDATFVPVRIRIGGKQIDTVMGFGKFPVVLLGQCGFFDKVKSVSFSYPKRFEIAFPKR